MRDLKKFVGLLALVAFMATGCSDDKKVVPAPTDDEKAKSAAAEKAAKDKAAKEAALKEKEEQEKKAKKAKKDGGVDEDAIKAAILKDQRRDVENQEGKPGEKDGGARAGEKTHDHGFHCMDGSRTDGSCTRMPFVVDGIFSSSVVLSTRNYLEAYGQWYKNRNNAQFFGNTVKWLKGGKFHEPGVYHTKLGFTQHPSTKRSEMRAVVSIAKDKNAPLVILMPGLGEDAADPFPMRLAGAIADLGNHVAIFPNSFSEEYSWNNPDGEWAGNMPEETKVMADMTQSLLAIMNVSDIRAKSVGFIGTTYGAHLAARTAINNPAIVTGMTVMLNPFEDMNAASNRLDAMMNTEPYKKFKALFHKMRDAGTLISKGSELKALGVAMTAAKDDAQLYSAVFKNGRETLQVKDYADGWFPASFNDDLIYSINSKYNSIGLKFDNFFDARQWFGQNYTRFLEENNITDDRDLRFSHYNKKFVKNSNPEMARLENILKKMDPAKYRVVLSENDPLSPNNLQMVKNNAHGVFTTGNTVVFEDGSLTAFIKPDTEEFDKYMENIYRYL